MSCHKYLCIPVLGSTGREHIFMGGNWDSIETGWHRRHCITPVCCLSPCTLFRLPLRKSALLSAADLAPHIHVQRGFGAERKFGRSYLSHPICSIVLSCAVLFDGCYIPPRGGCAVEVGGMICTYSLSLWCSLRVYFPYHCKEVCESDWVSCITCL